MKLMKVLLMSLSISSLGALAPGCQTQGGSDFQSGGRVSGDEARKLIAKGARLVDVRTVGEYRGGHIEGALNIPVQELTSRVAELEPKDKPIIVYCASGNRSARARGVLKGAGFTAVSDLGAIDNW